MIKPTMDGYLIFLAYCPEARGTWIGLWIVCRDTECLVDNEATAIDSDKIQKARCRGVSQTVRRRWDFSLLADLNYRFKLGSSTE